MLLDAKCNHYEWASILTCRSLSSPNSWAKLFEVPFSRFRPSSTPRVSTIAWSSSFCSISVFFACLKSSSSWCSSSSRNASGDVVGIAGPLSDRNRSTSLPSSTIKSSNANFSDKYLWMEWKVSLLIEQRCSYKMNILYYSSSNRWRTQSNSALSEIGVSRPGYLYSK